jgi:NAD(P)-dependent dehydrogenase (short-subunit alcohol dehydrogenase family)
VSEGRLRDRVVVVTGAANGGGAASARLFAEHGADCVLLDIDDAAGEAVAAGIRGKGHRAEYLHADVSDPADVTAAVESVLASRGRIDVLFNHAGTVIVRKLVDTTLEEWERLMRINVTSMFLMSKAVLPSMIAAGGGTILNTSSISGFTASPHESAYCVSKGAVLQLTRSIAVEYRDQGIRCNAICPGFISTNHGNREIAELTEQGVEVSPESIAAAQGRLCEPEEFAATALALVGADIPFVNGTAIVMDNGSTVLT